MKIREGTFFVVVTVGGIDYEDQIFWKRDFLYKSG